MTSPPSPLSINGEGELTPATAGVSERSEGELMRATAGGQSSFVNCSMNLTTMPLSEVMACSKLKS